MPVRSSRSSVTRWPDRDTVHQAVRSWAAALVTREPRVVAVGYFGSYARGEHGVGSDLDLVILLEETGLPPERRAVKWDLETLPVPSEALVYTLAEWQRLRHTSPKLYSTLLAETVWVHGEPPKTPDA